MKVAAVICAAGQGKRMQMKENKQFLLLNDKPLLIHTLEKWEQADAVDVLTVVVADGEIERVQALIDTYDLRKVKRIVVGGQERQDTVYNGLVALRQDQPDIVLIHDGARPFITTAQIESCISNVKEHGAAVLGVPVQDTIKTVSDELIATHTLDRSTLWAVQTPQGFTYSLIVKAHEQARHEGYIATDDAALVERMGLPVYIVQGNRHNIKLTAPADIELAKFMLKKGMG